MSVNVYWSVFGDEWMRAKEPQDVRRDFYSRKIHEQTPLMAFNRCPFTHTYLENTFSLHSLYDYSFKIKNEEVFSDLYDQEFFDYHVKIRSMEKRCFSFFQPFVFFTEEKSLEASFPVFPYLENNNITQRCIPFVGTLDIGKYFRNIDFAFLLKNPYDEFLIEEDEIFGYIKFNTEEKIKFRQFYPSDMIKQYAADVRSALPNKKHKFEPPLHYYNNFKLKKLILKEIKNNLL